MTTLRYRLRVLLVLAATVAAMSGAGCGRPATGDADPLTVYSARGLGDWYRTQFDKFTRETGIKVNLVEGGSGEVVSRVNSGAVWDRVHAGEPTAPADLLITLPPFIQKAAKAGLLQASGVDTTGLPAAAVGPGGVYVPIVTTALCLIAGPAADPQPVSWADLLLPRFAGKVQYSTPGEAGDGTAVLLLLQHLMGRQGALDYLAKLGTGNTAPVSSTASLQDKVSSGELLVANGDVQMNLASINNHGAKFRIFFPTMPDNTRTTVSLPYVAGVTAGSHRPEDAGRLLAFLLADEAQKSVATEAFGIPVRSSADEEGPGSSGALTARRVLDGVTLWEPDWNTVLAELESDLAAYNKAVR